MHRFARGCSVVCVFLASGVASAQFGREAAWMTAGRDAQRSSWVRSDLDISPDKLSSDFQFLWKVPLDHSAIGAPSEPVVMDRYIGYRGFRALAFMGDGGAVYAVDTDLNRIEWQKHFAPLDRQPNCPAGGSASIALPASAEFSSNFGGGSGRRDPARSDVGQPYAGAAILETHPAPPVRSARPAATPAPASARPPIVVYALTSDGMLHTLYVSNGDESEPAVKFVPPGSTIRGLIVVRDEAYAVVGENCGTPDELMALNLSTKDVVSWTPDGASIAGSEGLAIGPDGTLYVGTGKGNSTYASSVVALDPATLKPKDWYSVEGVEFTSTPVIFQYKNKVFAAAASKDGRMHVLDTKSLGGADHRTPVTATSDTATSSEPLALAVWQDSKLVHWLLASHQVGLTAWRLVDGEHGLPVMEAAWVSRSMRHPSTPIVINGVVFSASGGHEKSMIYALDAATGKELWSSKGGLGSAVGALSAGAGHLFATTREGALYAFGFPMEHE